MSDHCPAQVVAEGWCRVDFAGGTLDIWPLGLLHRSASTVNVALDLSVQVTLRRRSGGFRVVQGDRIDEAEDASKLASRPETALAGLIAAHFEIPPVEILIRSGSPRGGGLGASSALTVAMIVACETLLGHSPPPVEKRSALARDIEARLMSLPTGRQDHFPALLGGVLQIDHRLGGEAISRLDVDLDRLGRSLLVVYSGQSHFSAGKNWQVIRRRLDGDPEIVRRFDEIAKIGEEVGAALRRGDLEAVGALMSREWAARRGLAEGVSTPRIEYLLDRAIEAGAWGGKACGAGGGGCLAILAPEGARTSVERVLLEEEARLLKTTAMGEPIRIIAT